MKFNLNYHKRHLIDLGDLELDDDINNPYKITKLQQYNPIYSLFFDLNENNYNSISFNHLHHIINLHQVININTKEIKEKNVFIKFSPLLDPIKYMIGKYNIKDETLRNLPNLTSTIETSNKKIIDTSNASYVDNLFYFITSILLNHHDFYHGIDYYGSFLGIQDKFKMNVEEDLEYLLGSSFFLDNIGKIITLENYDDQYTNIGSRNNKPKLIIKNDLNVVESEEFISSEEKNYIEDVIHENNYEIIYENNKGGKVNDIDHLGDNESVDSSNDSETNYSTSSFKSSESVISTNSSGSLNSTASSEASDSENDTIAYINDFPMQMICLEKCEGTLDELFVQDLIDVKNGAAILFQIIMTILVYQKMFDFTHNDLHTNNVMFINTTKKYLWYKYEKMYYKVPTYGRIFKIIDFGRSIYKFKGHQFCSDSFSSGGDGATQYNCEPFMDITKKRLDPNPSFDLCRLGCSIYDFLLDGETKQKENLDPLQKIILKWVTDDKGHNVLYKTNGDERYPGFKLYKMISRSVHSHTPQEQLKDPFFKQFLVNMKKDKLKTIDKVLDIDDLPSYVERD
jgi:hypothetical protein